MTQVVECLPTKYKVLSSNSRTVKRKKKRRKRREIKKNKRGGREEGRKLVS
jgi:hypothetical protein